MLRTEFEHAVYKYCLPLALDSQDTSVGVGQRQQQQQQQLWNEDRIDAAFRRIRPNCIGFHIWKHEASTFSAVWANRDC